MNPVIQTILSRKSVRKYTGNTVSPEDLTTLIRSGMAAPCSYDKRCWFFVTVTDEKLLAKLAEGLPHARMILSSKHAIVVCADLNLSHGGTDVPYWIQDCSATVENILIAAESLGLGACWTGVHPRAERVTFVREVLRAPEQVVPLCVIAVGHPVGEEKPKDKFDPARIFWNGWGNKKQG